MRSDYQEKILSLLMESLKLMEVVDVEGCEGAVLKISNELKITFYDAS